MLYFLEASNRFILDIEDKDWQADNWVIFLNLLISFDIL